MTAVLGVRSWINKGQNLPADWVAPGMVGRREPNGTFLLRTKRGQQRVHVGAMVINRNGDLYSCAPAEARALVTELEEEERGFTHLSIEARLADRGAKPKRALEADVADRTDDTDEISRRIREERAAGSTGAGTPIRPARKPLTPLRDGDATKLKDGTNLRVRLSGFPKPLGMPPSIEMRHPDELRIDDSYQRSIDTGPSRALIERIARGWDWRMCLPLVVSKRDDGFYVIDGQRRHAAARMRGDIPFLPCCVAIYADVAEEAAMFVAMNRARRAINRLDDFHAAQAGGDADALAVAKLIEGAGFIVSRRTGSAAWLPGEVAFTSAIRKERRRHGDDFVRSALSLLAAAFPGERLVAGSSVFTAVCAVMAAPPTGFTRDRLLLALKTYDMKGWATFLDQSRGGTDRAKHLKEMLLAAYEDADRKEVA